MYVIVAVDAGGEEYVSHVPLTKDKAEEIASLILFSDMVVHTEVRGIEHDIEDMLDTWIVDNSK